MLIKNDLKRVFISFRFYISVSLALCILLRPLFDVLQSGGEYTFAYLQEFPFGFSDFTPFAVIFCVIPFADSFCDDYNSGYIHAITMRISPRNYAKKRFVSNALIGGFTEGVIVAITLLICLFSANTPETYESASFMQDTPWGQLNILVRFHGLLFFLMRVLLAILFGALWASVGLCISTFVPNRYITLVAPFVLYQMLWRLIRNPILNPIEALSGNSVPSLAVLMFYQLTVIIILEIITEKQILRRIRP